MPENPTTTQLDRAVWEALLAGRPLPMDREAWLSYSAQLRKEARGYWHGLTARLFERAGLPPEEWDILVDIYSPRPPKSLGDSCLDVVEVMMGPSADSWRRRWLRS